MEITETKLKGCFVLKPTIFEDERGYFIESFNQKTFSDLLNIDINFVQDNESKSSKGVLRGLHFQTGEYAQSKLVRVIKGRVLDVAVDLRKNSETYGEYISIEISGKNKKQFFVPRGFAHGFVVLEDETIFSYKCDNYYNKESESGIIYNDSDLNIDWKLPHSELKLSEKDFLLQKFKNIQPQ